MEEIQLFLNINTAHIPHDWNERISSSLSQLIASDNVQIIGKASNESQINLSYSLTATSLDEIQRHVERSGGKLKDINIHFTSGISGVSDPYGASGISMVAEESISQITGVLGVGISTSGTIKVHLDHTTPDKQAKVQEIVKILSHLNH